MKFILFCQNPYAFGILEPIMQVLKEKNHEYLWYITENLIHSYPFPSEKYSSKIADLKAFKSDAVLCPGNEVPHFLRGVKVQIFHGLAGEKKGHFRIRHYFDLYLTQGPYFTKRFLELKNKYKNFEVVETGWSKLDIYGKNLKKHEPEKEKLLQSKNASKLILYAPTFSPSLTSAPFLLEEIKDLAKNKDYLILVKFHDLMNPEIIKDYKNLSDSIENIIVEEDPNIIKFLLMADIMVSDTSSVVYEFLLLDKPVLSFKNNSENILWDNSSTYNGLSKKIKENLEDDKFRASRLEIIKNYHPYRDGKSASRMLEAIENFIDENGIPEQRTLPFLRRRKMNRMFKE